ncbi:MAG: hypothetical protein UV02_C0034G0001 [Candidatus Kuenenbacteria bacterium GW2011_GWA2_42_15]|uniref:Uncharacterized protein n=1 Tax=Candidatus Kuenenbacteria bacterium GW2011_GWA2_42_15 TaxID=1618677 RepID=A0A0G0YWS0_9BACT|nr:MAG: hypothetical protein UV02_C0034G0001 [Candidatus Kuenenbacteria bacterium GW2011_GWA2_42_15]
MRNEPNKGFSSSNEKDFYPRNLGKLKNNPVVRVININLLAMDFIFCKRLGNRLMQWGCFLLARKLATQLV